MHQCTDEQNLDRLLTKQQTLYIGFDATADSLHVGSLLPLMMLRWARSLGHRVIVLLGGGTTLVGDPSGKEEARKILDATLVDGYAERIRESMGRILDVAGPDVVFENNVQWLKSLQYIDFLRDVGAHFSVNKMLSFESVKRRLDREQNLSFLEFNYMLCQAYDFYVLSKKHGCFIQAGGSDQWGNIVNGVDLIRRKNRQEAYGITMPLLENKDGKKMGKTADGAVWLHKDKKSPYEYWQFWRNVPDEECERFLKLFTCLTLEFIQQVMAGEINDAKKCLADEATGLLHGYETLEAIHSTVGRVESGDAPFQVVGYDDKGNARLDTDLPLYTVHANTLTHEPTLVGQLAALGVVPSKGHARRLVRDGGCFVNRACVRDEMHPVDIAALHAPYVMHVRLGKKKNLLIQVLQ